MSKRRIQRTEGMARVFEGPEVLEALLRTGGSRLSADQAAAHLQAGLSEGLDPRDVFPALFEGEPRFPNPETARKTYENLFGLWDLLKSGRSVPAPAKEKRLRPKTQPVERPGPLPSHGPDSAYLSRVHDYLRAGPPKERNRLLDAFENRQDALLSWLDERALPDDVYALARGLLFELYAVLALGCPSSPRSVAVKELTAPSASGDSLPEAVVADASGKLSGVLGAEDFREAVMRGLLALWNARGR